MAIQIQGQTGPIVSADGVPAILRLGNTSEAIVQQLHGRYYEQAKRARLFFAATPGAITWSVGLATTFTGLVISNPPNSPVNLVPLNVGFGLAAAPAAAATIGLIQGWISTGITVHSTPLTPLCTFANQDQATGTAKADAAATLVGTPRWAHHFMGAFTAAALPSASPNLLAIDGMFVIPPGGYIAIGASAAVSGVGSIIWEEIPTNQ